MKIKLCILAAVWILSGVFVYGCIVINGDGFSAERIYGSGTLISEEREVPIFDQIHLKGAGKVILTRAEGHRVRVKTDDNIMPHIQTEVDNGKLVISHERKNLRPTVLTLHVTAANLDGVAISGSGDITANEEFNSNRFNADIAGSGDIGFHVFGSGSIYLAGSTNSYDATITGSGDVDAFELQTKDSSVVITGSGNCRINVLDRLQAKITGSGDVLYKGHPQISKSITGSGKVKNRN